LISTVSSSEKIVGTREDYRAVRGGRAALQEIAAKKKIRAGHATEKLQNAGVPPPESP
jgi:hypothetical protein